MMIVDLLTALTTSLARIVLPPTVNCDSKFGNKIAWRTSLRDALDFAKKEYRPLMVVIWMDGCPSCNELIPKVSSSKEIANLAAEEFVVVALNEHRDDVAKFRIDGGYTPRIFFLSPQGDVDLRFYNKWDADPDYKYYYPTVDGIVKSMNEVVNAYPDRCTPSRPCHIHA